MTKLSDEQTNSEGDTPEKRKAPPVTSAGGGLGAKLADRYEGYWTVLRGVIPVLKGSYSSLVVEPPGLNFVEFKLSGDIGGGPDEGHQCKRSRNTSWTLAALRNEGFLAGLDAMTSEGVRGVFVSEQKSVLGGLEAKAKRMPPGELRADLSKDEDSAHSDLMIEWDLDETTLHERLKLISFEVIGDRILRHQVIEGLNSMLYGDPETAHELICGYVVDTAPRPIDAPMLRQFLNSKGHTPRSGADTDLSVRVGELTDRYVSHVDALRPASLQPIERVQTREIVDVLASESGAPTVVLVGAPGMGKSYVLARVVAELQRRGHVVGVLRLDVAQRATSAEALGNQEGIDFGGAPARVLARAKANQPGVLVIDQVDTASTLSGRGADIRLALREVVEQARSTEGLKILLACRSEDLKYDGELRRLVGIDGADIASPVERVVLGELSPGDVVTALTHLGFRASEISGQLLELLRNPLNLGLFTFVHKEDGSDDHESLMAMQSRISLLRRYHEVRAEKCRDTLGPDGYTTITMQIAQAMNDDGALSLPSARLARDRDRVNVLRHHGVVVEEGQRIRFFHESYFDFVMALVALTDGKNAAGLLSEGPQELIRRGQVRAILTIERDQDPAGYRTDLREVLSRRTRSHIRAAVFSLLQTQNEIDDDELQLLLSVAVDGDDPMSRQAVNTLASTPFVGAFVRNELLDVVSATYCEEAQARRTTESIRAIRSLEKSQLLYLLFEAARSQPAAAAEAALPIVNLTEKLEDWLYPILRLLHLAGPAESGEYLLKLYVKAIGALTQIACESSSDAELDTAAADRTARHDFMIHLAFSDYGVYALDSLIANAPDVAPSAIRAWLEGARKIFDRSDVASSVFDRNGPLPSRDNRPDFALCAQQTPIAFVEELAAALLEESARVSHAGRWRPKGSDLAVDQGLRKSRVLGITKSLASELITAFMNAVSEAAGSDSGRVSISLGQYKNSDLLFAHEVLATAYGAASGELLAEATSWVEDRRVRGLPEGHTPGWAWGKVIARVAAAGSSAQRARVLAAVSSAYFCKRSSDVSDSTLESVLASEEHVVLALLHRAIGEGVPVEFRHRLADLDATRGAVPAEAEPKIVFTIREEVGPRISVDLDDSEWLAQVSKVSLSARDEDQIMSLERGLQEAAKTEPNRFARLLSEFPESLPASVILGVLRGLTDAAEAGRPDDRSDLYNAVRWAFQRPHDSDLDMGVVRLIHHLAGYDDVPDEIILILDGICDIARNGAASLNTRPEDMAGRGLMQPRGLALNAIAAVLNPVATRPHRVALLTPTLRRTLDDPSDEVRVWLPQALVRVHSIDPELASDLTERWLTESGLTGLVAQGLDRLIWQIASTRPSTATAILNAMAQSPVESSRQDSARMVALFDVRQVDLPALAGESLFETALATVDGRIGIADVLAQLVDELAPASTPDESPIRSSETLLLHLMDDDDEEVRDQTAVVVSHMLGPLSNYADLLSAIAKSKMFAEKPSMILAALDDRLGELPECVLDLCEKWIEAWVTTADDIGTIAAADSYHVADIALSVYSFAPAGSTTRDRCLAIVDRLAEFGAGGVNLKADEAVYDSIPARSD